MDNNVHHHPEDEVSIRVNGVSQTIHRGSYTVTELKQTFHIPSAEQFGEVKGTEVIDLPNDTRITVKGGEVFISYMPTGQSS